MMERRRTKRSLLEAVGGGGGGLHIVLVLPRRCVSRRSRGLARPVGSMGQETRVKRRQVERIDDMANLLRSLRRYYVLKTVVRVTAPANSLLILSFSSFSNSS